MSEYVVTLIPRATATAFRRTVYVTPEVVEAVQLRFIWVFDTGVATKFEGGAGAPLLPVTVN